MPRTRQPGGTRVGAPGASYPQRTDLNQNRTLPVRVAQGQTYGKAQAQMEAQRAVPMQPPPTAQPSGGGNPMAALGGSPIPPGAFGDIHRPTERPMEPVTHGAALGPGAGPEALGPGMAPNNVSSMLQQAAQKTGSNVLAQMAQRAAASGQ